MGSLEGSFFTGLDTGGGGGGSVSLPLNQVGYGTGSGITSSADLTFVTDDLILVNFVDDQFRGLLLETTNTSNKPSGVALQDFADNFSSRRDRVIRYGYNVEWEA